LTIATSRCAKVPGVTASTEQLVHTLVERRLTLATAESVTAGLCALSIVEVPDSGAVMLGSVVAYASAEKRRILGVDDVPVISAACAQQMAAGVMRLFASRCALAFTGVAGPAEQEGRPVGTVFISAAVGDTEQTRRFHFEGGPDDIRRQAVDAGAAMLTGLLESSAARR
jgi:nicotinamide-nucleotide amidase